MRFSKIMGRMNQTGREQVIAPQWRTVNDRKTQEAAQYKEKGVRLRGSTPTHQASGYLSPGLRFV
jgi:hypothetical protein